LYLYDIFYSGMVSFPGHQEVICIQIIMYNIKIF